MRGKSPVCPIGLALVVPLFGCGDDNSAKSNTSATETVESTLGPAGGKLTLGEASVTFAPGALRTLWRVTITRKSAGGPDGFVRLSDYYEFTPKDVQFELPVTVVLPYRGDQSLAMVFWSTYPKGVGYESVPGTVTGSQVSFEVTHFSSGFVADGDQVACPEPEVLCENTCINLLEGFDQCGTCDQSCESDAVCAFAVCMMVPPHCGDGILDLDEYETCDGSEVFVASCAELGFTGGSLTCDQRTCQVDEWSCYSDCNNGVLERREDCDGTEFPYVDTGTFGCENIGLGPGTLGCNLDCTFDASGCGPAAHSEGCGNGVVDAGEQCDGKELSGKTCANLGQGFTGGSLMCSSTCTFNTSACTN